MSDLGQNEPHLNTPTERALFRGCKRYKAERDRYRDALLDLAGEYGCTIIAPPDPSERASGTPCRDRRPDDPNSWCYACIASAALEEPDA